MDVVEFVERVLVAANMHGASGTVREQLETEIAHTFIDRMNSAKIDAMSENDVALVQSMRRERPDLAPAAVINEVTSRIPGIDRLLAKTADDLLWELVDNLKQIDETLAARQSRPSLASERQVSFDRLPAAERQRIEAAATRMVDLVNALIDDAEKRGSTPPVVSTLLRIIRAHEPIDWNASFADPDTDPSGFAQALREYIENFDEQVDADSGAYRWSRSWYAEYLHAIVQYLRLVQRTFAAGQKNVDLDISKMRSELRKLVVFAWQNRGPWFCPNCGARHEGAVLIRDSRCVQCGWA